VPCCWAGGSTNACSVCSARAASAPFRPSNGTGFAPIVDYPEVAILGTVAARLKPLVQGDLDDYQIVPRLMIPLVLAFDHRVLDGAEAARFVNKIIDALEDPEKSLSTI
jgi:pyruvate dehydrogenase E2 component (dihydrolipoamide acetyltransferase)